MTNYFVPVVSTSPVADFDIDTSFSLSDIVDSDDFVAITITELFSEGK